jgi:hypothetical protein
VALLPAVAAIAVACTPAGAPGATTSSALAPVSSGGTPPAASPGPVVGLGPELEALRIDDHPHTEGYRRSDWPTWKDIDNDGCDARSQALIVTSDPPAVLVGRCDVVSGTWRSAYDNLVLTAPDQLDVDHVVPLEDAYRSGGWQWSTDRRTQYANDQADLWVVSASTNRSKGSSSPDVWRPPAKKVWCEYARRWAATKIRWELTATTPERDALGQMLDTCTTPSTAATPGSTAIAPGSTTFGSGPPPSSTASTAVPPTDTAYYANCAAARAANATPLHRGEPGYREEMDGDHDGIACE